MTATIKITPAQFGRVAAEAIARGLDVTSYLVQYTETRLLESAETPSEVIIRDDSLLLDSLPEAQPEPEDAPVSDFFADVI